MVSDLSEAFHDFKTAPCPRRADEVEKGQEDLLG